MPTFALLDCNSYYCSVEQAFQPSLRGKPLIVLSNNDGCAIARTAEAKAIGIKMGEPWHLAKRRPECANVEWRSSNYALYADMSRRVYEVLAAKVPGLEPYSIDESFFALDGISDQVDFCRGLREDVRRLVKIPTCIGIGPTKTVAKLANKIAKSDPANGGVCDLSGQDFRDAFYARASAADVWGIGGRIAERLEEIGVQTIEAFVALDPRIVRSMFGVVGARVQAELLGVSCLPINAAPAPNKSIMVSRSLSRPVGRQEDLRALVATYAARAAARARRQGLEATSLGVLIHTNRFAETAPQYGNQITARIEPTADAGRLIAEAARLLDMIWRPGFAYSKAGVMLFELLPAGRQPEMLSTFDREKSAKAMQAMDALNARFGRGRVRMASTIAETKLPTQQGRLSPSYTTKIEDALVAIAI